MGFITIIHSHLVGICSDFFVPIMFSQQMEEIHWDFCFPVVLVVFMFIYQNLGFVFRWFFTFFTMVNHHVSPPFGNRFFLPLPNRPTSKQIQENGHRRPLFSRNEKFVHPTKKLPSITSKPPPKVPEVPPVAVLPARLSHLEFIICRGCLSGSFEVIESLSPKGLG